MLAPANYCFLHQELCFCLFTAHKNVAYCVQLNNAISKCMRVLVCVLLVSGTCCDRAPPPPACVLMSIDWLNEIIRCC